MRISRAILNAGLLISALGLAALVKASSAAAADSAAAGMSGEQQRTAHEVPPTMVGWVERIELLPEALSLDAKLAPGSEGNVIHAESIKEFKKNGEPWVSFSVSDNKGHDRVVERRVIDKTRYRTTSGKLEKRFVVESALCIGKIYLVVEFALADRSQFEQKLRIGRETLAGNFVIDPARTRTTQPKCKRAKK